jgi:dihydrodipicolinate synthase/N-acetylneuraminate lyase
MVQNAPEPIGAPLATPDLMALIEAVPSIEAVKEETAPNPQRVGALVQAAGPRLQGVIGGLGGIYLFNELARGATGTMPACQFADVMVKILALVDAGEHAAARAVFAALQPALVMERLYGMTFMKACLQRRGVLTERVTRVVEPPLDAIRRGRTRRRLGRPRAPLRGPRVSAAPPTSSSTPAPAAPGCACGTRARA